MKLLSISLLSLAATASTTALLFNPRVSSHGFTTEIALPIGLSLTVFQATLTSAYALPFSARLSRQVEDDDDNDSTAGDDDDDDDEDDNDDPSLGTADDAAATTTGTGTAQKHHKHKHHHHHHNQNTASKNNNNNNQQKDTDDQMTSTGSGTEPGTLPSGFPPVSPSA